ncbi:uncharacterized protein E0L32_011329 [Thyridium curvatum]|uniref:Uncharacterized protein n=1 Tax=Thyridium curvatum TaxID=1093900 RepID=A0A507B9K9_9PEZI|nr:uncharacterized protein E0L32_011329 [Thyridium curvatum]TPX19012.1 hypothetical protein E0L32_011329 [Thyridium curvatum]
MAATILYKTVWSVCTHYKITPKPLLTSQQLREGQDGIRIARKRSLVPDTTPYAAAAADDNSIFPFCCGPYNSTKPPKPDRLTTDVVYGWCDRCVEIYRPFSRMHCTELRSEAAVLGFWAYMSRHNISTAVKPGVVPPTAFLTEPGGSRREETRRRMECLALGAALRRNTTRRADEMVEMVEWVRMETLRWAVSGTWEEYKRQLLLEMHAGYPEHPGLPREDEDEGRGATGVVSEQPRRHEQMQMQMPGMPAPTAIPPPPQRALPAPPPRAVKKRKLETDAPRPGCSGGGPPRAPTSRFASIDWDPPAAPAAAVLNDGRHPSFRRKPLPPGARARPAASKTVSSGRKLTKRHPAAESKARETTQASHVMSDTDGTIPFMMLPHSPPPPSKKPAPSPPSEVSSISSLSLSDDTPSSQSGTHAPQQRDHLVPSSSKQIKDLFSSDGSSEVSGLTSEASSVMQYPGSIDAICKKENQKKKDERGETRYGGAVAPKVGEAKAGQHAPVVSTQPYRSPDKAGVPLPRQDDAPSTKQRAAALEKQAATLRKQAETLKKQAKAFKKHAKPTKKRAESSSKRLASTISGSWLSALFTPVGPY